MIVRRATAEDISAFSPLPNKPTILAWVGDDDGKIIGIGGLALVGGRWFAFCDLKPEARKHKKAIVKTARNVMMEAKRMGIRFIYAEADSSEPGARRWIESLGFHIDPRSNYLFRWRE